MRPLIVLLLALASTPAALAADTFDELRAKVKAAIDQGKGKEALALADQAVNEEPANPRAYLLRGSVHEWMRNHPGAVADFTKTIELDPKAAEAYNRRGSEHFKLGHIAESIADFDRFLELRPDQVPGHWQRGISYYYADRFEEGWKQFKGYEKVDTNDVENAVWHYLCLARSVGREKARASMLKIGKDRRVPMMEVYALFKGAAKPEDVLAAACAGGPKPDELKRRLFYAHLYLGLYYESLGDKKKTLEHMTRAARDYQIPSYMGDVARVHLELLRK